MNHAEAFFAAVTRALDLGVEADNLAGLITHDPLKGACAAWTLAAREAYKAWEYALAARDLSYDICSEANKGEGVD